MSETGRPGPSASRAASFRHAFAGWAHLLRTQRNARIHLAFTIAVIGAGLWLRIGLTGWALVIFAMGLVWTAELFNTAIEASVDLASPDCRPLARTAKDTAAGAVLAAAVTAALIGLCVLGPPLLEKSRPALAALGLLR